MKHVLARDHRELLAQLAWSRVLLAFDFDGTLAPIVRDRERARMRRRTANLLAKISRLYPCAVISGRGRRDVRALLGRVPVRFVVGNHGIEPGPNLERFARLIKRARPLLEARLAGVPGVEIENKRFSLSVHYRKSRQKRLARAAIQAAVEALPFRLRQVPGKLVVNLLPGAAPTKGDALLHLRAKARLDTALYVGDDVTDEDVFALDQPGKLCAVRVGRSRSSAAAYFLRNQREIDRLLRELVALRERGSVA